jgi:hypothetical protein
MAEKTPLVQADAASMIFSDPDVQQAMAKAGADAANNPAVQAAIQQAATQALTEKGPDAVKAAAEKAMNLAGDPVFQAQLKDNAMKYGTMAGTMASSFVSSHVQQGPLGVRILCFIAGVLSLVNATLEVLSPMRLVFRPFVFMISAYQAIFSVMTMLFEAPPEWLHKVPFIDMLHDQLMAGVPLLATTRGRGLFYIFQSSLWLGMAEFSAIFDLVTGFSLLFVGIILIGVHFLGWNKIKHKMKGLAGDESPDEEEPEESAPDP